MKKGKIAPVGISIISICFLLLIFAAGCGNSGSASNPNNVAPVAAFTVSKSIGSYPLNVTFNCTSSTDSDGTVNRCDWQFGDGSTATGTIVSHIYTAVGNYTAQLTATDNGGKTDTVTKTIEVKPLYTLSGTITSAEYIDTDSDVNDPFASYVSNDSFASKQEITAPVSVSGYVNLPGRGSFGRSFSIGDRNDYYHSTLRKDMDITLYMAADPASSELTLYLYNNDPTPSLINSTSTDNNGLASFTVPDDGDYYVRVEAASYSPLTTASMYVLNIGNNAATAVADSLRLSDDFVPGEVLVRFDDQVASSLAYGSAGIAGSLSAMGLYTDTKPSIRQQLWKRSEAFDKNAVFENLGIQSAVDESLAPGKADAKTVSKLETLWMVRALRRQAGVKYADPNYIRKILSTTPNDTYYSYQWHYPLIGLPEAWDVTTGSSAVTVAVVDTGILSGHPDLQGQIVSGYDFISSTTLSLDGDGVDPNPEDPGDQSENGSSSFHGTHVSGTIAAKTNNNLGVAGIAWNSKIMPLRVLGKGGEGTTNDILEAVRYAAGLQTNAGVQLTGPVDVINLSLGSTGYSKIEEDVFKEARAQGVIIVASAGNSGSNEIEYPAGYEGVVSVSATTITGSSASYSNYGPTIDVAAPGGSSTDVNGDGYMDGVLSTAGDDSSGSIKMIYAFYQGTSMAAPHVSGVVALMKSLYPDMTPDEFDTLLAGGYLTHNYSSTKDSKLGWGIIDAYKAVLAASDANQSGGIPVTLTATPGSLNFGTSLSSLDLTVNKIGNGTLHADPPSANASWLSITPSGDVDSDGFGTYTVTVDRSGLMDGTYTGQITVTADTQQVQVFVVMRVGAGTGIGNGGYHYILLLDADTYGSIDQDESAGVNGVYQYSFSGVPYGNYYIYAGTDSDNDGYICTEAETCGAYLSIDQPAEVLVDGNKQGIDFSTDILFKFPEAAGILGNKTEIGLQRNMQKQILK